MDEQTVGASEELKDLDSQAKEINQRRKELREKRDASKGERKEARATMAQSRTEINEAKAAVRKLSASSYDVLKSGDHEKVFKLAEDMREACDELVESIDEFALAQKKLNEL